ncbi:MAG TPA: hypothetical protein DEA96_04090 [Leptospiraceae bacterium]|nr:hypothetical protein [Leptospiraceae bacterium]
MSTSASISAHSNPHFPFLFRHTGQSCAERIQATSIPGKHPLASEAPELPNYQATAPAHFRETPKKICL